MDNSPPIEHLFYNGTTFHKLVKRSSSYIESVHYNYIIRAKTIGQILMKFGTYIDEDVE